MKVGVGSHPLQILSVFAIVLVLLSDWKKSVSSLKDEFSNV